MTTKRMGRGTVLFGLLVLLAGVAGAVVLFVLSQQRGDDAIRDLARAPVGCDTTLTFTDTGTFYVYIEHLGTLDSLDGDCETPDEYARGADDEPTVEITVTDDTGAELDLDRLEDEFTYSLDDSFAGTATRRVEIESTGDYVVTVDSDDDDFVVAVGRDPGDTATALRLGAFAAGIAGIVLGLGLMLIGVRRSRRAKRIATTYTAPVPGWAIGTPAPTAPPMMQSPQAQAFPAPQQTGEWAPVHPVGPPVATPGPHSFAGPRLPGDQPTPGSLAPPRVFAPPAMPVVPSPPTSPPTAFPPAPPPDAERRDDGGDGDDVRGDASR
jgi:hypothetical protein